MRKKTAPLFDPRLILDDLRVAALSLLAQLFYFKLCALADSSGGVIMVNGRALSLIEAAALARFAPDNLKAVIEEVERSGLIELRGKDGPWVVTEMVAAQSLRDKRAKAGRKGGASTTVKRHDVCLSKRRDNVIYLEKTKGYKAAQRAEAKKEKRTKKEKNNNKYIYIHSEKVFTGDRGSPENPAFMVFEHFTLYRSEYRAIERAFPMLNEDRIDALLAQHDRWLEQEGASAQAAWLACLLGLLRKVNAAEARAAAIEGFAGGAA